MLTSNQESTNVGREHVNGKGLKSKKNEYMAEKEKCIM